METLSGKRVLITGGASGIGYAIAKRFAADGAELVLVDVNRPLLERAAVSVSSGGPPAHTYMVDVTDLAGIRELHDRVTADVGPIDVLVNSAGVVFGGSFPDVPIEKHLLTYHVNVLGLVAVTHAFFPDLLSRPDAHIVNLASASGYVGLPLGSTYASSKWAVIGFSESIELELTLRGQRQLHVTTVCPSYVSTGLFDGANAPLLTRLLTADRLAERVHAAVLANRRVVRAPWLVAVTPFLKGLLPFPVFYSVARALGVSTSMTGWHGRDPGR